MKHPDPRLLDRTALNIHMKRRGVGVVIEWRPMRAAWDIFRYCDATSPRYNMPAFKLSTPKIRTDDWFEVCCYALSPQKRKRNNT